MGHIHPKANIDGLYLQRCEGGRDLIGLTDCVQVEVHSFKTYLSTLKEKILKEVTAESLKTIRIEEVKKKYLEYRAKYDGKPLHGQFRKATEEVRNKGTWNWLKKGYLKKKKLKPLL